MKDIAKDDPLTLDMLQGAWKLGRVILEADGRSAQFIGKAEIRPEDRGQGSGMVYHEHGTLHLPGERPMHAERRYLFRAEGALIDVRYDDGRPFHRFDPNAEAPEARHDCGPDRYHVRYDFSRFPSWSSEWVVQGPRKSYVMTSHYSRVG
ncbi:DUF6314 family protein [Poseidonocella sedimentorum]|uniref:DUF6314 domain-containing protein n=1 Tax=Poseidonocella sedimentorum TaxID=871652 RepID=A0A1I6EIP8_9RHOB|nr:DUF6314 family protein [Poseidonocella sedimentorum]SFR17431.1 hypothetical protein SAMN04515673_11271 [Poseidonocella sedimentorum]